MPTFCGYPAEKEGPLTLHNPKRGDNPILRGLPLAIAGFLAANTNFIPSLLWSNADFGSLRKIKDLINYEPRYDPTVVPLEKEEHREFGIKDVREVIGSSNQRGLTVNPRVTVHDFHAAFAAGEVTPSEVTETLLQLITTDREHAKAFLDINRPVVLAAAEESSRRYKAGRSLGILDGVPVGVKDEVDLEGHQSSLGTSKSKMCPAGGTSWCVKKLEEAGAIVIGKLNVGLFRTIPSVLEYIEFMNIFHNMHELGLDATNNNGPTGRTPLNPHNPHYYTGGSSGGSAYTVSTGLLPITLGADGGGSIRIPSTFCGIYGLKPSHGRISASPTQRLAKSNGVYGPMASNMSDLEIGYRFMAIPDPNNSESSSFAPPRLNVLDSNRSKTIGIYKPWFEQADPPVLNACYAALSHFKSAGYNKVDIRIPYLVEGQLAHAMTILSEISSGDHQLGHLAPANKILLSLGKQTPSVDFLLAQKMRSLLMEHLAFLFRQHPGLLIVTPTSPIAGWHIVGGAADLRYGISDANSSLRSMEYTWLANFTGCPALTIPVGMAEPKNSGGKIPMGMMAMAEWGAEEELLRWGRAGEQWSLGNENGRIDKPQNWTNILKLASKAG
ncbi:MAG: hypothetical protein Q9195_001703 [Heterodermia aff. obscurata]